MWTYFKLFIIATTVFTLPFLKDPFWKPKEGVFLIGALIFIGLCWFKENNYRYSFNNRWISLLFIWVSVSFGWNFLRHIYAAGDVTGLMPLETIAAKQANFAVRNMFENAKKTINYNEIPGAVFTSPEVAVVGIGEDEYMKKYKTCLCRTITIDHVEKAGVIKDTRGVIRMVLNHKTKQVIGVHIIAPMAADIITTATYAIKNKMIQL